MIIKFKHISFLFILIMLFTSCSDDFSALLSEENRVSKIDKENLPPNPGQDGAIYINILSQESIRVYWKRGSDKRTPTVDLQYIVYMSLSNNISTYDEAVINGDKVTFGWTVDISEIVIDDLAEENLYYLNVFTSPRE